jgi:type IV pilus assembly protein PilX
MMSHRLSLRARSRRRPAERGFILVIGLLFMLVLLMLSAAMFRSFTMQEKIAGNTRDKQRSFEVAQGALQYAETWLNTNATAATPVPCAATTTGLAIASLAICDTDLPAPTGTWPSWYLYPLLPTAQVGSGGGVIANGDIKYQAQPGFYISKLGLNAAQDSLLFQVTSFGGGGSAETRSVLQSTYRIPVSVPCRTCAP